MYFKFIFLYFFCIYYIFGQNNPKLLIGKVIDDEGNPLSFSSVYINNSTIGTISNEHGEFSLNIPSNFKKFELVASFVGFTAEKLSIDLSQQKDEIVFNLKKAKGLNETVVKAKRDKAWRKRWLMFKKGILGDNRFAKDCEILNYEEVRLSFDKNTNQLTATSEVPLIIENKALGYKIKFDLHQFVSDGTFIFNSGTKFFEDILSEDKKIATIQLRNRRVAYNNSFRSFLQYIIKNDSTDQRFEVFSLLIWRDVYLGATSIEQEVKENRMIKLNINDFYMWDSILDKHFLYSKYPLLVFNKKLRNYMDNPFTDFPFFYSRIYLPNYLSEFTENGWMLKNNGITFFGYWAKEGLADLLPENYSVEPSGLEEIQIDYINNFIDKNKESGTDLLDKNKHSLNSLIDNYKGNIKLNLEVLHFYKLRKNDKNKNVVDLLSNIKGLIINKNEKKVINDIKLDNRIFINASNTESFPLLILDERRIYNKREVLKTLNELKAQDVYSLEFSKNYPMGFNNKDVVGGVLIVKTLDSQK
jgi:hypothetical protein